MALLYCFFSTEVLGELRRSWRRIKLRKTNRSLGQHCTSKRTSNTFNSVLTQSIKHTDRDEQNDTIVNEKIKDDKMDVIKTSSINNELNDELKNGLKNDLNISLNKNFLTNDKIKNNDVITHQINNRTHCKNINPDFNETNKLMNDQTEIIPPN